MTLLLNSDLRQFVQSNVVGRIGRAGGTMNQLMTYRNCSVEDLNLHDGGFGVVKSHRAARSPWQLARIAKRYLRQEIKCRIHGHRVPRDRKTILLDMHHAHRMASLRRRYDCSVSSNLIEHSYNPIQLLLNFHFATKANGWQYHAIPHYRYTFDMHRTPTTLEHMVRDFERGTDANDRSHDEDYIQSAIVKHGWQRKFHARYPVAYPYMHYHVFDEHNTRQLFEFMFAEVRNDVLRTDEHSDNLVICRNTLNTDFVRRYGKLLGKYLPDRG